MDLKPNRKVLVERADHARATKNARKTSNAIEKWLDGIAFWKANTAKKRFLKRRKVRKAAHVARREREPIYNAWCEKRHLDYMRCRANSCHNAAWM